MEALGLARTKILSDVPAKKYGRGGEQEDGTRRTRLVVAAVMSATEDHVTTCRKGGTDLDESVYASEKNRSRREKSPARAACRLSEKEIHLRTSCRRSTTF